MPQPKSTNDSHPWWSGPGRFLWDTLLYHLGRLAIYFGTFFRDPTVTAEPSDRNRTSWIGLVLLVLIGVAFGIALIDRPA
jgi:hypothetical protein